jgi:hypothetical protein
MSTLDPLTEPLVRLFLRIDAASPTDPALRALCDFWKLKRGSKIAPSEADMTGFSGDLSSYVFLARLTPDEAEHWIVSGAGYIAAAVLQIKGGQELEITDKRIAVRLRRLFDIVAEKIEPYSAMFEIDGQNGQRQLVEVFAAPLGNGEKGIHMVFAAINSRIEAKR